MYNFNKKYIITGAPATGKTTLINLLKEKLPCMDEVSRKVIMEQQETNGRGIPWLDLPLFSELVYHKTMQELSCSKALICDRSLLDLEAYFEVVDLPIPPYLLDFPYQDFYHNKVYFAPTWQAIYCQDKQRLQDFDYCLELEKSLLNKYLSKGFEIIRLPKSTPLKRVEFILKSINTV